MPEAIAAAPPVDNHDHSDGEKDDEEEVEQEVRIVRSVGSIVRSVVHDEFTQTSEKKEIKKEARRKTLLSGNPLVITVITEMTMHVREAQNAGRDTPVVNRNVIAFDKYTLCRGSGIVQRGRQVPA